jgi:hypothetical protein
MVKKEIEMDERISDKIRDYKEHFPNLTNGLTGYDLRCVEQRFPKIADYIDKGELPNAELADLRSALGRAIENGYKKLVSSHIDFQTTPPPPKFIEEIYYSVNKDLHTIFSSEKKIDKIRKQFPEMLDHPINQGLITWLNEAKPLAEVGQFLKEHAVKRAVKSEEERKAEAKYVPPMADKGAEKLVKDALTKIAEESYEGIKNYLTSTRIRSFERAIEKSEADPTNKERNLTPLDKVMLVKYATRNDRRLPYTPYPNKQTVIQTITNDSERDASDIREQFVVKNLRKIASIIDKKGGLTEVKEIGRKLDIGGLEGRLRFSFSDGSSFEANNSVVHVQNEHGTQFQRYPLTFHNIVSTSPDAVGELKKGQERLASRSEEWMNKAF